MVETEVAVAAIAEDTGAVIAVHPTVAMGIAGTAIVGTVTAGEVAVTVEAAAATTVHLMKPDRATAAAVQMITTEADREAMIDMEHRHCQNGKGDTNLKGPEAMEVLPLVGHHHPIIMRSVETKILSLICVVSGLNC